MTESTALVLNNKKKEKIFLIGQTVDFQRTCGTIQEGEIKLIDEEKVFIEWTDQNGKTHGKKVPLNDIIRINQSSIQSNNNPKEKHIKNLIENLIRVLFYSVATSLGLSILLVLCLFIMSVKQNFDSLIIVSFNQIKISNKKKSFEFNVDEI